MSKIYDSDKQIVCISNAGNSGTWKVKDSKGVYSDSCTTDSSSIGTIEVSHLTEPFELWQTLPMPDNIPAFSDFNPPYKIIKDIIAGDVVIISGPATYTGGNHINPPTEYAIVRRRTKV
ncbi:hypothetical protein [Lewinella cohaerens]|uniref:hypothetical protein n=1 Tax=Lewinella cohaerens TaxID=70995 RepID=UPI00035E36B3|nr:hypothetical protein [Lewinella cohaerens]